MGRIEEFYSLDDPRYWVDKGQYTIAAALNSGDDVCRRLELCVDRVLSTRQILYTLTARSVVNNEKYAYQVAVNETVAFSSGPPPLVSLLPAESLLVVPKR